MRRVDVPLNVDGKTRYNDLVRAGIRLDTDIFPATAPRPPNAMQRHRGIAHR